MCLDCFADQYYPAKLLDYIAETRSCFGNIKWRLQARNVWACRDKKNTPNWDWQAYSVYLRKSFDFQTWQKGSQAWWYMYLHASANFATKPLKYRHYHHLKFVSYR